MMLNRAQRREMSRRFKQQGRDALVLRGGPMDGWTVTRDAAALRPDWRPLFLEAEAEGLFLKARKWFDRRTWHNLSDGERAPFRAAARTEHGAGRYELKGGEASAVWREEPA